ncbi:MAG TPA: hypothetical protein VF534_09260 [Paraburkholderia sp.]
MFGIDNIVDTLLHLQVKMFDADRASNENLGHSSALTKSPFPRTSLTPLDMFNEQRRWPLEALT